MSVIETVEKRLGAFSEEELAQKRKKLEDKLFEFANFVESKIILFYMPVGLEADTTSIIRKSMAKKKIIALPNFESERIKTEFAKVDDIETELKKGSDGRLEPDMGICKSIPVKNIDIAIIPGAAFDEKGGRIALDNGYYDRLIARLPVTTRKIAIALEEQIVPQISMDSKSKYVDIIITDKSVIYKI